MNRMKNTKEQTQKNKIHQNAGITLIALVITIIVLLILAGVAIASLTGDNGLLGRALSAKEETIKETGREQINVEVLASYGTDGKISYDLLNKNLSNIAGLTYNDNPIDINGKNKITVLPAKVKLNGYLYKITGEGSVENKKEVVLPEGLKIGDTVEYVPTGSTYTWRGKYATTATIKEDGESTDDDVELNSETGGNCEITNWIVYKIDEDTGEVQLVPSTTKGAVKLQGANGYNNGVKMLNDACKELYSNTANGIKARSINIEDIENVLTLSSITTAKNSCNYNSQVSSELLQACSFYPLVYEREKRSVINGIENTTGLDLSETSTSFIERDASTDKGLATPATAPGATDGSVQANVNIQPYKSFYQISLVNDSFYENYGSEYKEIFYRKTFWIASRCISIDQYYGYFMMQYVSFGYLNNGQPEYYSRFRSYPSENHMNLSYHLFPVVTVDVDLIVKEGDYFKVQ